MSVRRFLVTSSLGSRMDVWAATYANWRGARAGRTRDVAGSFGEQRTFFSPPRDSGLMSGSRRSRAQAMMSVTNCSSVILTPGGSRTE